MAPGHERIGLARTRHTAAAPGALLAPAALAFITIAVAAAIGGLLAASPGGAGARLSGDPYIWRITRFTLWQAALSTLLSLLFAIPVARALARRAAFPGRGLIVRLLSLPLALPQLVAVLGLLAVWGRAGWLAEIMRGLGVDATPDIYGLSGILLAHVFFNMPLATRLLAAALERLPDEYWRLAEQLNMTPRAVFRLIEWPAMRAVLPGIAALIFMLCAASFTVVLTLGGGPAATTLEVAIYQALRFDFDPPRAVALALLQLAMTAAVFLILRRFATIAETGASLDRPVRRGDGAGPAAKLADAFWLLTATLFTAAPLAGVILSGLRADLPRLLGEEALRGALVTSIALAFAAAATALALAWAMLLALRGPSGGLRRNALTKAGDLAASLILVIPPVVIGAGWFVILLPAGRLDLWAPAVVALINALMALPFVWRVLRPAFAQSQRRYGRLCAQLGLGGWSRLRLVDWPTLRRPAGLAGALALALSIGDLGAIALFGSENFRTLPWLLYQRLGSYRTADAAGLALILLALVLALMSLAEWLGGRKEHA